MSFVTSSPRVIPSLRTPDLPQQGNPEVGANPPSEIASAASEIPLPTSLSRWARARALGVGAGRYVFEELRSAGHCGVRIATNLKHTTMQGLQAPEGQYPLTWSGYYSVEIAILGTVVGLGGGLLPLQWVATSYVSLPAIMATMGLGCSTLLVLMILHRGFYLQHDRHSTPLTTAVRHLDRASDLPERNLERLRQIVDAFTTNIEKSKRRCEQVIADVSKIDELINGIRSAALKIREGHAPIDVVDVDKKLIVSLPENFIPDITQNLGYKENAPIDEKILLQLFYIKLVNRYIFQRNHRIKRNRINSLVELSEKENLDADKSSQVRGDFFEHAPFFEAVSIKSPHLATVQHFSWSARLQQLCRLPLMTQGLTLMEEHRSIVACVGIAVGFGGAALAKFSSLSLGYVALPHLLLGLTAVCLVNLALTVGLTWDGQATSRKELKSILDDTSNAEVLNALTLKRKIECFYDLADQWVREFSINGDSYEKDYGALLKFLKDVRSIIPNPIDKSKKNSPLDIADKINDLVHSDQDATSWDMLKILRSIKLDSTFFEYDDLGYVLPEIVRPDTETFSLSMAVLKLRSKKISHLAWDDWCLEVVNILRGIVDENKDNLEEQLAYRAIGYWLLVRQNVTFNILRNLEDWDKNPEDTEWQYISRNDSSEISELIPSDKMLAFFNRLIASRTVVTARDLIEMLKHMRLDTSVGETKFKEVIQAFKHLRIRRADPYLMRIPYILRMLEVDASQVDYRMYLDIFDLMIHFEWVRLSKRRRETLDMLKMYRRELAFLSGIVQHWTSMQSFSDKVTFNEAFSEKIESLNDALLKKRETFNRMYDSLNAQVEI